MSSNLSPRVRVRACCTVHMDEIGQLVANAYDDQWREVLVMAAGHALPEQGGELLCGLLKY